MTLRLPVIETLMIREGLVLCPKGESQNFNEGHAKFVQSLTNEVETWEHSPMLSLSSLLWFFEDEERPLCPSWVLSEPLELYCTLLYPCHLCVLYTKAACHWHTDRKELLDGPTHAAQAQG